MKFLFKIKSYQWIFIFSLLLVVFGYAFAFETVSTSTEKFIPVRVVRIIDGQTIVCRSGDNQQKVVLVGVEAVQDDVAALVHKRLLLGKDVFLETDIQPTDKQGNILAYLWLRKPGRITDDSVRGKMYNYLMVKHGYMKPMQAVPNIKYASFLQKEKL